jgi:hypothetical protein
MTQTAFVEKWERCNRLLSLRRHTETESAAICERGSPEVAMPVGRAMGGDAGTMGGGEGVLAMSKEQGGKYVR